MINKDGSSENRVSQAYDLLSRNEGTQQKYFAEILEFQNRFRVFIGQICLCLQSLTC